MLLPIKQKNNSIYNKHYRKGESFEGFKIRDLIYFPFQKQK